MVLLSNQPGSHIKDQIENCERVEKNIHGDVRGNHGLLAKQISFILIATRVYAKYGGSLVEQTDEAGGMKRMLDGIGDTLISGDTSTGCYVRVLDAVLRSMEAKGTRETLDLVDGIAGTYEGRFVAPGGATRDWFSALYQSIFSIDEKHASGEHYTPVELCTLMVRHLDLEPGTTVLDPACGTGAFLVAAIAWMKTGSNASSKEIAARIHGTDINPVAIVGARFNVLLELGGEVDFHDVAETVRVADACSDSDMAYDTIVGNPPWVTLKDLPSKDAQERNLATAKALSLATGPHDVPQLEIATVIFAHCARFKLAPGGSIFMVLTSSFIDGKHCGKFRRLDGLQDVEIWTFSGDAIFPRPFACLRGTKGRMENDEPAHRDGWKWTEWDVSTAKQENRPAAIRFAARHESTLVPAMRRDASAGHDSIDTGPLPRFIPEERARSLLPTCKDSPYKRACHNGATVFPQNLLFVRELERTTVDGKELTRIMPDLSLNMKKPWDFLPYETALVDARNIFDLYKGSELYPFGTLPPKRVFLPLVVDGNRYALDPGCQEVLSGNQDTGGSNLARHFVAINALYMHHAKKSSRLVDIWKRINFDNELTNAAMRSPFKVLIPDCGSVMAAAIARKDCIIEHALHYIGVQSEAEAYYLMGILNAPSLGQDLLLRKAERHIGQIALEYCMPVYASNDETHAAIGTLARDIEGLVRRRVNDLVRGLKLQHEGKMQCVGCRAFIAASHASKHLATCKGALLISRVAGKERALVDVSRDTFDRVTIEPSRRKIKGHLLQDTAIQERVHQLDGMVMDLLQSGMNSQGGRRRGA